jgi:hypothetical protein
MNNELFQNLLTLIRPRIEKKNTFMRDAVSAEERLAVTICCSSRVARFCTRVMIPQPTTTAAKSVIPSLTHCNLYHCACIATCSNVYGALTKETGNSSYWKCTKGKRKVWTKRWLRDREK